LVRPGILTDEAATDGYAILDDPATWGPGLTSRHDVGAFAVICAAGMDYVGRAPVILTRKLGCRRKMGRRW
jgi:hypothetical protein